MNGFVSIAVHLPGAADDLTKLRHDGMMKVLSRDHVGLKKLVTERGLDCDYALHGRHVLSLAVERSSRAVVQELVRGGASVTRTKQRSSRDDPLLVAVRLNRADILEELLRELRTGHH
ncbi:uncharacterized protein LOC108680970 [Hyalella azteca]|uniref:Uncharacterized protein LOC108680970 n=1 Tax=Hyalella azteca TaxID=294128 RepID=A0A8B7PGX0_HYAAZ|nr:uncharacterized protein LOC108680970 [Hyalella azteca]